MRTIKYTLQFEKDWRRETKGRSAEAIAKLKVDLTAVTELLQDDAVLPRQYKDHPLSGKWKHHRDCHVRNDLVLIYSKPDQDTLALARLGSHSELFR